MFEGFPIKSLDGNILFYVSGLISLPQGNHYFQKHPPITQARFPNHQKRFFNQLKSLEESQSLWETLTVNHKAGVLSMSGHDVHLYFSCWSPEPLPWGVETVASIAIVGPKDSPKIKTPDTYLDRESTEILRGMLDQLRVIDTCLQNPR